MRVLLALLLVVAACSDKPGAIVVGFSQVGADNEWRTAETRSILDEAKARGIELKFADAQGQQENQIKALRSFIAQRVDAILLAPQTKFGWEPILTQVKAAGIPVILVDRGVEVSDASLYVTLIASDFTAEGRMAGEWLAKRLAGKGNVVELCGTTGADPAIERAKGFREALATHPGLVITKSQDADFARGNGKSVMEALLKADPGITAVYAHNDAMALGAILAIEEAGKKPGADIVVVSIDAIRAAFEAMAQGKLDATVECTPLLGPLAFDALAKVRAHEELPRRVVVEDRLFEKSQAAAELPKRKY